MQETRGEPYNVGDLVRMKTDANEVKKKGKKLAYRYSGKYKVVEVLTGGWTYKLQPSGWKGRTKIRHFNDLKDAGRQNIVSEVSSEAEYVLDCKQKKRRSPRQETNPTTEKVVKEDHKKAEESRKIVHVQPSSSTCTEERPKRNRKPPSRLQVGIGNGKSYSEVAEVVSESDREHDNDIEESILESTDSGSNDGDCEWFSGAESAGSTNC